jgi:hypothetical protein
MRMHAHHTPVTSFARWASATVAALCTSAAVAHGGFQCNEPTKEWKLREELENKLKAEGWEVRKIKIDQGCYEVYGFDGKGQRREAYFNPKTFDLVGDVSQK